MSTTKVFYELPPGLPIDQFSIDVTSDELTFLMGDDAVVEAEPGRFEFTDLGKDRIREAPDPE